MIGKTWPPNSHLVFKLTWLICVRKLGSQLPPLELELELFLELAVELVPETVPTEMDDGDDCR